MPGRSPGVGLANTPASPPDAPPDTHPSNMSAGARPPADRTETTGRILDTDVSWPSWPVIVSCGDHYPLPNQSFTYSGTGHFLRAEPGQFSRALKRPPSALQGEQITARKTVKFSATYPSNPNLRSRTRPMAVPRVFHVVA